MYDFGTKGAVLSLIADKTELDLEKDNRELMICDYVAPTLPPPKPKPIKDKVVPNIKGNGTKELKVGGNYKVVTGYLEDAEHQEVSATGEWTVITIDELTSYLQYKIDGNVLKIKATDDEFAIGGKVRLQFSDVTNELYTYVDFDIVSNV